MTGALGIDHPLVAVHDIAVCRATYEALGFQLTPQGQHPWGTATSLILFHHQILELVSIGDASLLGLYPAGEFSFGHHVQTHLNTREGVALSALYTSDAAASEVAVTKRGVACAGTIDFGRDVIRADGQPDRTSTTLKIFPNLDHPRLSVFACQQHRRDLLEFPHLMDHPNGAHGIDAVTVVCEASDRAATLDWLSRIHGTPPSILSDGDATVQTSNGAWRICDTDTVQRFFGACNLDAIAAQGPTIIGVDIRVKDLARARRFLPDADAIDETLVLPEMDRLGGVMLRFAEC